MKERSATILIIDISGYSQFVKITGNSEGACIISNLLETIMQSNKLSFKVSEIEGDAILFYKYGHVISVHLMLLQFEAMLSEFQREIKKLQVKYPQAGGLSIKMVVHYGTITEFSVGGFHKIYGQAVVEAHRLLKNHIHSHTYALVTEDYFLEEQDFNSDQWNIGSQHCEIYDVGKLCYTFFPFDGSEVKMFPASRAIA